LGLTVTNKISKDALMINKKNPDPEGTVSKLLKIIVTVHLSI
jgi:hypothetical protein